MTGLLCTREFFLLVVCVLCTVNTACRNPNQNKHNQISNKLQTAARTSQTDKRNEIIQMWNGQTAYFNKQGKEKQMWGYLQKKKKKQRCLISSCSVISTAAPEGRVSWFYYLNRFSPGRHSLCACLYKRTAAEVLSSPWALPSLPELRRNRARAMETEQHCA